MSDTDDRVVVEEAFCAEPGSTKALDHLVAALRDMYAESPVLMGVLCLTKDGSMRSGWLTTYQLTAELAEELIVSLAVMLSRDGRRLAEELVKMQQQGPERGH